ncbi:MAG: hypothetical protein ACREH8_00870 [Opitutaceae bacterium]
MIRGAIPGTHTARMELKLTSTPPVSNGRYYSALPVVTDYFGRAAEQCSEGRARRA